MENFKEIMINFKMIEDNYSMNEVVELYTFIRLDIESDKTIILSAYSDGLYCNSRYYSIDNDNRVISETFESVKNLIK